MYTNRVFGTAKCVLFIEVSSFHGVLIKGAHCIYIYNGPLVTVALTVSATCFCSFPACSNYNEK